MKKILFIALVVLVGCRQSTQAQTGENRIMIAFYNVENLFDTINDPRTNDEEFTPAGDKEWNNERYQNKLNNLAKVISSMNNGKGPDIIGLCEIENFRVLKDLVNHKTLKGFYYGIVHAESPDNRGIDVALLYKEDVLPAVSFSMIPVELPDTVYPTRSIMLVETEIEEHPLSMLVCHFPSRSEGQEKSEYKRIIAAGTAKRVVDSLMAVNPKDNILLMGDFNDEPTDSSMRAVLGGVNPDVKQKAQLFNLMYPLKNSGKGTYKYKDNWDMLDQVIVNANIITEVNGIGYEKNSATIFAEDWMKQTEPKYFGSPMRTFGGKKYLAGYSDHFPVYIYLQLKK